MRDSSQIAPELIWHGGGDVWEMAHLPIGSEVLSSPMFECLPTNAGGGHMGRPTAQRNRMMRTVP